VKRHFGAIKYATECGTEEQWIDKYLCSDANTANALGVAGDAVACQKLKEDKDIQAAVRMRLHKTLSSDCTLLTQDIRDAEKTLNQGPKRAAVESLKKKFEDKFKNLEQVLESVFVATKIALTNIEPPREPTPHDMAFATMVIVALSRGEDMGCFNTDGASHHRRQLQLLLDKHIDFMQLHWPNQFPEESEEPRRRRPADDSEEQPRRSIRRRTYSSHNDDAQHQPSNVPEPHPNGASVASRMDDCD